MQGPTTIAPPPAPSATIGGGAGPASAAAGGGTAIARPPAAAVPQPQQSTAGNSSNNSAAAPSAPAPSAPAPVQTVAPQQQQQQQQRILPSPTVAAVPQPGVAATAPVPPPSTVPSPLPTSTTQSPLQQQQQQQQHPTATPTVKLQQQEPQQLPAPQPQQQQTQAPQPPLQKQMVPAPAQQQQMAPAPAQQHPAPPQQQQAPPPAPQQQYQQQQPIQYQQHAAPVPPLQQQQQQQVPATAPPAAPQAVQYQQQPPQQQQRQQQVPAPAPQQHPPQRVQYHQQQVPAPSPQHQPPQHVQYQQPPAVKPQCPPQQVQYQQQPLPQQQTAPAPPQQVHYQQQKPPSQQVQYQQQPAAPAPQPVQYQQQQQLPPAQSQQQPAAPPQPVQGQAPPQQHYPHQGLNGGWQSDKDVAERRKMIAKIVHLLQQRKPNAPQEWLKKLPQMAKRLEESLYRSAKSFAEYNDATTLKQRLQQLAVNIGMKTRKLQQAQQAQLAHRKQQVQQQQPPQHQYQQQPKYQHQAPPQQQQPSQHVQYQQHTQQQQPQPQQGQYQQQPQAVPAPVPLQQPHMQAPPPSQSSQIVNMSDINPIMGGASAQPVQTAPAPGTSTQVPAQVQYQQMQSAPAVQSAESQQSTSSSGDQRNGRHVSDRQQVLRHQQQRLLLLRHAAKCQHEDGRCPVTPHCAGMKRLWKHIAECKDQKCLVPHCVSSRYVLSHYHRCKDVRCPVCGPVREAIHRSHEKQKQMQALKQRHQAAVQQSASQPQQATNGTVPGQPPAGGALTQPAQPAVSVVPALSGEPPNKRRKSSSVPVLYQQHPQPIQPQPQPLAQQLVLPGQPVVKAGYVYSHAVSAPVTPGTASTAKPEQAGSPPGIAYSNGQVIMPKHSGPKPQEDHTLINCFTIEEIETHIASLNKGLQLAPQKLKSKCLENLKVLQSHQHGWVFNSPVDPIELGLPDYFQVIKRPMDLGTIKKRLENGCYHSIDDFENDVLTTFDNAMLYNPEGSVVYNMAKEMKAKFTMDYENLIRQLNEDEEAKRKNGEACLLCGCERLLFEPAVFYCNGLNCSSKRIRRNSYYYVGGNNQYHWCHQCYGELKDGLKIELGDVSIKKEELTKKKNDEVHEESWVQCDKCERWIHQICGLFNTRQNKDQRSEYCCPRCTIEERNKKNTIEGTSTTPMAEELPRTKLSEFLEERVRGKVDKYFENQAKEKAATMSIPLEEAKENLHMGGPITIRQVTSMDRKLEVRDRMKRRYAYKNYPDEFTFRCKCIVVFQKLDGVDVILFGLYVYEHDENNPAPNTRTVYVSYLDSVHFMRPRSMRTFIYHEILIAYLDYVRKKGFVSAHIWACPPLKGDDYILYAKPEDQKTPKDERLRQWYLDMLVEAQKRSIVGKLTNMYDLYFKDDKNDATIVPYMDGDYFPAEVENIIKDIEEGKTGKKDKGAGKKKKGSGNKAKTKKKSSVRGGTRSTGLDEDALAASGIIPPGYDTKSLQEGGRDFVMAKLRDTIQPMKESFIVAYLNSENAKPENLIVSKAIQECRKKLAAAAEKEEKEDNKGTGGEKKEESDKEKYGEKLNPDVEEDCTNPTAMDNEPLKKDADYSEKSARAADENSKSEEKKESSKPSSKFEEKRDRPKPSNKLEKNVNDPDPPEDCCTEAIVPSNSTSEKASNEEKKDDEKDSTVEGPTATTVALTSTDATANETSPPAKNEDTTSQKSTEKLEAFEEATAWDRKGGANNNSTVPENSSETPGTPTTATRNNPSGATVTDKPNTHDTATTTVKTELHDKNADVATTTTPTAKDTTKALKPESSDGLSTKDDKSGSDPAAAGAAPEKENEKDQVALQRSEGKFAAMAARNKRDADGNAKEPKKVEKDTEKKPERLTVKDSKGRIVKVIDDDAEEMDCEFLNNRQAFLNLCQGNHYQFDQLRRAKHTSMMVLWHLHNRDAPKFVQQCASCSREILTGYRYHCPTCADYDQCQDCVSNPNTPRHPHLLKPIPVASGQQSELTEDQRKERQRSIQLHMTLLQHAATCNSAKCPSANCTKMKGLLKHGQQCQIKATGGCHVCKRIWALLQLHARQCKASTCPVPNCMAIRERFRQLKKQQQAMDDRRRQEMNRHYRSMGAR